MSSAQAGRPQTWHLSLDGSGAVVELLPYSGRMWGAPNTFRVGDTQRMLDVPPNLPRRRRYNAPITGAIDIGAHRVTITRETVGLAFRAAIRRNLRGLTRSGPLAFVATMLGGAGLGGGVAAAGQSTLTWMIYALDVDGEAKGSWVARAIDGVAEDWTWVPAGGALPDNETLEFHGGAVR